MSLTVRLATPLRAAAAGQAVLSFDPVDVASLAAQIAERYPELAARVLRDGQFGPFVNVFVDGEDLRFLGADGDLRGKSVVEILPAMSGGDDDLPGEKNVTSGAYAGSTRPGGRVAHDSTPRTTTNSG
jgi:molybdopterin converting factor small subunit